jgi:RNA polymerase sigma factor (sigma-70 family)
MTDIDASIDDRDTLARVLDYMTTLPERDRAIVMMRIWDDLSYDEISAITGESVSNSKQIVSRTLQKISANVSVLSLIIVFSLHALNK